MAGIFTRKALTAILNDADATPEERADQIFSLYGRAVDDGFVTKAAAEAAKAAAIDQAKTEWEKNIPQVNVLESEEYKALKGEFEGYKTKQTARTSEEFKDVKPKFFDRVYDLISREDGAKSVSDQLAEIKEKYEEYFVPANDPVTPKPQFGSPDKGAMPKGDEGASTVISRAWGFAK